MDGETRASFSLVTHNCFGTPTTMTSHRLRTLARELNERAYTLVNLQEVQAHRYRRLLTTACAEYTARAYEPFVHAPKGGLLTLARLPIERAQFTLYSDRQIPYPPAVMDWMLHKGVLETRLTVAGVPVIVLNTHLNANYSGDWRAESRYARAEQAQLQQLAGIIAAQPRDALVIVTGDFNIPRASWLYEEFLAASGMIDPLAGDTRATYRVAPGVPARYALPIDFAFVRAPRLPGLRVQSDLCFGEKMQLAGSRRVGFLSDHLGVELRIEWGDA
jgi:endonuclease/exonuclease/phosphatase family metal-dependent hydrolase